MKKATILGFACALLFGAQSVAAQEAAQEVTYVSDPSQGVMLNRTRDNWFITAEGGADVYFARYGQLRNFGDRFAPTAGIYVGKWFSPVFGGRFGANWMQLKGVADRTTFGGVIPGTVKDGKYTYYKQKFNEFGPQFDLMINLTNWWCGYRPGRVYNAIFYVGAGGYFSYGKDVKKDEWKNINNTVLDVRAGLLQNFRISEQMQIGLDLRWGAMSRTFNSVYANPIGMPVSALLSLTYNFKNREFVAPVVPVYPEPENCDALRARLAAADARIADLEAQLKDCLARPTQTVVEAPAGPIATIYFPIGVSRLSAENNRVVKAIANVMTQNPSKKYVLTGWADNYTGTDNINMRLRKNRADNVQKVLVRNGVPASQLTVTTNNGNLNDLGIKCVALDRAVTIDEAK